MDFAELSDFLSADFITFTFLAGLMFVAHSNMLLMLRELTSRESARAAAGLVAQAQLRMAVEFGAVPLRWSAAKGVVAADPSIARRLGIAAVPAKFILFSRLIVPEDRGEWFQAVRNAHRSGKLDVSIRLGRGDRLPLPVAMRAEVEFDLWRRPQRAIGLMFDLTPKSEVERVETPPDARDATADFRKGQAVLAHELSQPVGRILGLALSAKARLAEFPNLPEVFAHRLRGLADAATDVSEVIRRVHARSRGEPIPLRELDLNEVVRRAADKMRGADFLAGANLVLELDECLPRVRGDAVELTQLLRNLIRNAAEATASVDRIEPILVRTSVGPLGEVCVAVIDQGPGLPREATAGLFVAARSTKPDGMGLGLSICRDIARAHHGTISGVNNADGGGATFTLALPPRSFHRDTADEPDEVAAHRFCCG